MAQEPDYGIILEGKLVWHEPGSLYVLEVQNEDGSVERRSIPNMLGRYEGQEVRLVLVPVATINAVAQMVEAGEVTLENAPRAGVGRPT